MRVCPGAEVIDQPNVEVLYILCFYFKVWIIAQYAMWYAMWFICMIMIAFCLNVVRKSLSMNNMTHLPLSRDDLKPIFLFGNQLMQIGSLLTLFGQVIAFLLLICQSAGIFRIIHLAFDHQQFVTSAITELVNNSAVVEVDFVPHVVSPLSVSVNSSGKKRLILDLRHVNQSVWKQKIKFKDWRVFSTYVDKGGFLFSFDLKSGYHHVDIIFPAHWCT